MTPTFYFRYSETNYTQQTNSVEQIAGTRTRMLDHNSEISLREFGSDFFHFLGKIPGPNCNLKITTTNSILTLPRRIITVN